MVVAVGVDGELAEEFAGACVDDPDVEVLDEHPDGGPGEGSAHADVVQAAVDAQGELAVGVDAVGADPVVGVGRGGAGGGGFGSGAVGAGRGRLEREAAVRPVVVVGVAEGVEQVLELPGRWPVGRVGRGASSSGSAGTARLCRRSWGGWVGCSSG